MSNKKAKKKVKKSRVFVKKSQVLVVYETYDEILVCRKKHEPRLLRDYFQGGSGRDIDEYDRKETNGVVEITTDIRSTVEDCR